MDSRGSSAALDEGFCGGGADLRGTTFAVHSGEMASYLANGDSSPFPFGMLRCAISSISTRRSRRARCWCGPTLGITGGPISGLRRGGTFARKIYRLYDAEERVISAPKSTSTTSPGRLLDALERFLLMSV